MIRRLMNSLICEVRVGRSRLTDQAVNACFKLTLLCLLVRYSASSSAALVLVHAKGLKPKANMCRVHLLTVEAESVYYVSCKYRAIVMENAPSSGFTLNGINPDGRVFRNMYC